MALWWHKLLFFLVSRCVVCVRRYMRSHVCVLCLWTLEVGLSSLLHVALSFVEKGLPAQLLTLDSVSQGSPVCLPNTGITRGPHAHPAFTWVLGT